MNKKISILLALIITLLIYLSYLHLNNTSLPREKAIVGRVIDGDTLVLNDGRTIRLLNINSPEKSTPLSQESTSLVKLLENETIEMEINDEPVGDTGRMITSIVLLCKKNIFEILGLKKSL